MGNLKQGNADLIVGGNGSGFDETLNEKSIKQKLNSETVIRLFLE
jgi:hypothetical protein